MWIILAVLSALCLGFYDVSKKQSLRYNHVVSVLFGSVCCSSLLLLPFLLVSRLAPDLVAETLFYVPCVDMRTHGLIFLKSVLVLSSWLCAYIAMKHLPITLVSPVNATRPMWTLLGAVVLFQEHLNGWQWAGVAVALVSFFAFSMVGQKEGIRLAHNGYIYCLLAATLLGACSGLYDKYLMHSVDHNAVQVYYTFYQAALMGVVFWAVRRREQGRARAFRLQRMGWIVSISVFLILSDFVYLLALSDADSLISVVSTVRRGGVIIPFLYGAIVLKDRNVRWKSVCLIGVLLGMVFLLLGTLLPSGGV